MVEYLAIFGFMVMLVTFGYLLKCLYHEKVRQHVVAKHYKQASSKLWSRNWFEKADERIDALSRRLYLAERNASNASYRINCHIIDNKHTKTAKKIAIDKERKELEKEELHSRDLRGCGDGM